MAFHEFVKLFDVIFVRTLQSTNLNVTFQPVFLLKDFWRLPGPFMVNYLKLSLKNLQEIGILLRKVIKFVNISMQPISISETFERSFIQFHAIFPESQKMNLSYINN